MSKSEYNIADIENAISNVEKTKSDIDNSTSEVDNFILGIDHRVKMHFYHDFTKQIRTQQKALEKDSENCNKFHGWLSNTRDDLTATIAKTEGIANQAGNGNGIDGSLNNDSVGNGSAGALGITGLDSLLQDTTDGQGDAKDLEYNFDPETFGELPSEIQEKIKVKLKELGFSDEEIEKILNGEVAVNKVALETLSAQLEQALKNNPSLRDEIIKIYGFDIFNADGTVNKDKLALAMIMDDKNPNDKYDLKSLLRKLNSNTTTTNDKKTTSTVTPTKPKENDPTDVISNDKTIVNNNGMPTIKNNVETLEGVEDTTLDNENALTLDGSNMATSIPKGGQILPDGSTSVKKGSMGAVAAGLGTAIAAAAGGIGLINKKDKEDDEDDDIELLTEEDDDNKEDEKNQKDWLLDLGIGLTGAIGVSQLISDDEEEDDDDDDDDDNSFYPSF